MFKKMSVAVLTMSLWLTLPVSGASLSPGVSMRTTGTIESHGYVKARFKCRSNASVRGKSPIDRNRISPIPSSFTATVAESLKLPNLIGSVVQSNAGLGVGIYSITDNGLVPIKTGYTMNASHGGAALGDKYICCYMDQF